MHSAFGEEIQDVDIGESVVSASGFEQLLIDAPASISVVTPQEIATRPARDLAEALANVPGVSIDSGVTKTGGYGISIRGMPSSYTLILVDGKRINGDSSLFPNGFGDSITSFMPPLSAIERIEVIRGPASTLYGSDAIGGVVNIITKKNFDKWGASFGYDYTLQENKAFGNTQGFSFYTAGPLNEAKNWGLTLRGRQYTRDYVPQTDLNIVPTTSGATSNAGRNNIVGLAPAKIYNIGGRLNWASLAQTNSNKPVNSAYLDLDYSIQNYDNSQGLLGNYNSNLATEQARRAGNGYGAKMNISRFNSILAHRGNYIDNASGVLTSLSTDTSLQYNITQNPNRYVPSGTFTTGTSANGVIAGDSRELSNQDIILDHKTTMFFDINPSFGIHTSIGARYWYNIFHDKLLQAVGKNAEQSQHIGALFAEAEFGLFERLFFTLGGRGNFNSNFGGNFSPRAYIAYTAIEDWLTFKGGISTGYKTPALSQLVNGIANLSGQGSTHTYGNPNLKPESSINYELSALSDNQYFSLSLTGFYTNFIDKIETAPSVSPGEIIPINGFICTANGGQNPSCSISINVNKAIIYGSEIAFSLKPIPVGYGEVRYGAISFNGAYTYTESKITEASDPTDVGRKLQNVPLHNINASLNYDSDYFGAYIRQEIKLGIWRGFPNSSSTVDADRAAAVLGEFYNPIFITHLGGYFKISDSFRVNFAVYNLTNVDFVDYGGPYMNNRNRPTMANNYNYIREGRRYYLSLNYEF